MTAWHEVVKLRHDVRHGTLAMSEFAADLYTVMCGVAEPIYNDAGEFFKITFATRSLRQLAAEVCQRLAGDSDKAIRQLAMTYGGGKTHALITLYHLVHAPEALPDVPAVQEFTSAIGKPPVKTRVAAIFGDQLDDQYGMTVMAPDGVARKLRQPWTVLAWQIAGEAGLQLLSPDSPDIERNEPPAQGIFEDILRAADMPVLILIDEMLMYARKKVRTDSAWLGRLEDFFQCLTQAVGAVPQCALVASLLSTDPEHFDELGQAVYRALEQIFKRVTADAPDLPVEQTDVPEVLRRRLFELDTVKDLERWRPAVKAVIRSLTQHDEDVRRDPVAAEAAFMQAYPFHPDLMAVFYSRWTALQLFQRTRGVLRVFAQALRHSAGWDTSPVITPAAFLNAVGQDPLSNTLLELARIAKAGERADDTHADWQGILARELGFAREIQQSYPTSFPHREMEAAVLSVFLNSQPTGHKAQTRDLVRMAGVTLHDRVSFERALTDWSDRSWFLDDELIPTPPPGQLDAPLPTDWRLGPDPNLKQMHAQAKGVLAHKTLDVDAGVVEAIRGANALSMGASSQGAKVHNVPEQLHSNANFPPDDDEFHFVILRPEAACTPGNPCDIARRMIDTSTSVDRKRAHRNLLVLLAPTPDGVALIRDRVLDRMAWEQVVKDLQQQQGKLPADHLREREQYADRMRRAEGSALQLRNGLPNVIKSAYCIGVTVNEAGEIEAHSFQPGISNTFDAMVREKKFRIQTGAMNPEALLPGGEFQVWHEDDPSRRVKDLVSAFSQMPGLPKILKPSAIYDTIASGCEDGLLVLRLKRPDGSIITWWKKRPEPKTMEDKDMEAWLPEKAELISLAPELLIEGRLPELWEAHQLPLNRLLAYFSGTHCISVELDANYSESRPIPCVPKAQLDIATSEAVRQKYAWYYSDDHSIFAESVSDKLLSGTAILLPPPRTLNWQDVEPTKIPDAWTSDVVTVEAIVKALRDTQGRQLPWTCIRPGLVSLIGNGRCRLEGALSLPEAFEQAKVLTLHLVTAGPAKPKRAAAELMPHEIVELGEHITEIHRLATEAQIELTYGVWVEMASGDADDSVTQQLDTLLRQVKDGLKFGQ